DTRATNAGWPVDLNATASYNGIPFVSLAQEKPWGIGSCERDRVQFSYSGYLGDCGNYHGWVVGVDINNPANVHGWATTALGGGIWGHSGVASGGMNTFVITGNTFNIGSRSTTATRIWAVSARRSLMFLELRLRSSYSRSAKMVTHIYSTVTTSVVSPHRWPR